MLVLSRRTNEKLVFPTLGVTIHVVRVQGNTVRIGIDAPPDVRVFREEVAQRPGSVMPEVQSSRHDLRNRFNKLGLSLHLIQKQLDVGHHAEAAARLEKVLPLLEALERELRPPAEPARPAASPACRALVVEDDDNERELLAGLLRMHGCDCRTAANGKQALADLGSHDLPDVVLLDLFMPDYDGRQTLQDIRANPRLRGLKVFAVSGTSPNAAGLTVGPNGLDAWFPKPLDPCGLWDAIRQSAHAAN